MDKARGKGWAAAALVLLAAVAVGGAIVLTGGPIQARKEARDRLRVGDLGNIWRQISCRAESTSGRIDSDVAATEACPNTPRLVDPFTDTPYRIEPVDAQNIRLCAAFETDMLSKSIHARRADREVESRDCMVMHGARRSGQPDGASLMPPNGGVMSGG